MDIIDYTTSDGPGFRTSIYCAGCSHQCKNCHNQHTWDFKAGKATPVIDIYKHIIDNEMSDVTFSGGDPMFQPLAFAELAKMIKQNTDKTIWCYTGFTIERLLMNPAQCELLKWVDVVVDGKFVEELKDPELLFRGSSNQRLIDAKASLAQRKAVLHEYDPFNLAATLPLHNHEHQYATAL